MPSSSRLIPKNVFLKNLAAFKKRLPEPAANGTLNGLLAEDSTPPSLLLGCILENYHYVKAAPQHIGVAVTHCHNPKYKSLLVDFFVDEHNHEEMILETLTRLGLKEKDVVASHPTIGTMALISLQSDMGRQSSLAYLACRSLNEATKVSVKNRREVFRIFAKRYGFKKNAFDPLLLHAEEDLKAGHVSLVHQALKGVQGVSSEEAAHVFRWMSDMNQAYGLHAHAIIDDYMQPGSTVPRQRMLIRKAHQPVEGEQERRQ